MVGETSFSFDRGPQGGSSLKSSVEKSYNKSQDPYYTEFISLCVDRFSFLWLKGEKGGGQAFLEKSFFTFVYCCIKQNNFVRHPFSFYCATNLEKFQ